MKILDIKHLKKIYHTNKDEIIAIKDITFSVNKGDFISIVGPSGCGKSTILSILANICDKSFGEIELKQNILTSYMLQNDCLLPFRTIYENCILGLEITNKLNNENIEYVNNLLKKYGLFKFKDNYPNSLSGGMRQRAALIRTLSTNPDILLLDEALSALDYQSRLTISEDVYNIIKNEGKTAIMVTHDIAEAISMSDKVIVISKRPAIVKNIYDIKLINKNGPIKNREDPNFYYYFDLIWRDLDVQI